MELIDRDALTGIIETMETIEAEPIRHGYWRVKTVSGVDVAYCTCCKAEMYLPIDPGFEWCPYCGARMDGR